MATVMTPPCVDQLGEVAGLVWRALDEQGPTSLARLPKVVEAPRDQVIMAVGWLAREGKIGIEDEKRKRIVSLL